MSKNLIIDTNLLLFLVIGAVKEGRHIQNSKRLNGLNRYDYDKILEIMKHFENIFITPYIAAEVSNLIDLKEHVRILAYEIARTLFSTFKKINVDIDQDCKRKI